MRHDRPSTENDSERKTYSFVIEGRLPGLNEYITAERSNRYRAAKMKADSQKLVSAYIMKHLRGIRIRRPVVMHYLWIERDRRRDKSNICGYGRKVIEDALVMCKVLKDDGWDEIENFSDSFGIDRQRPRIIVTMEET